MSAEASGWVWKHSPFTGSMLLVHLAIADIVNDLHGNEFWMSTETLAKKARVSRSTVTEALRLLVEMGLLEVLEPGGASRRPTRYRFLFASAVSDATSAVTDVASAPSARDTKEPNGETKGASAISGLAPDPACIRCRGTGRLYRGGDASTGAFDAACSCCDARPFVAVEGLREDIDA